MRLEELELRDFRNHRATRALLGGSSTLLLGENGSGKTSWIEAAVLLSIGRSFRGARDRELIRRGSERFEVRGLVANRAGVPTEITARGSGIGTRDVRVDGSPLPRLAELLGRFPTVHFSVEDVAALNGAPAGRRRFLDVALCQLEPAYIGHLREYVEALRQRNRLLGEGRLSPLDGAQFGAWEEILARSGVELDRRRGDLSRELDQLLRAMAMRLEGAPEPAFEYAVGENPGRGARANETVERRAERLAAVRARDRVLGWTSEGPHRAAVACRIGDRDLSEGGSRGMSRLYSILLRLALARVLDLRLEEPPVLFLDDPESELDPRWMVPLLGLIPEGTQVLVTACRPPADSWGGFRSISMNSLAIQNIQRDTPLESRA